MISKCPSGMRNYMVNLHIVSCLHILHVLCEHFPPRNSTLSLVFVYHWHHHSSSDGPKVSGCGLAILGVKGRNAVVLDLKGRDFCWGEAQDTPAVKCSSFSWPGLSRLCLQVAHSGCFPLKPWPVLATGCAALPDSLLPARLQHSQRVSSLPERPQLLCADVDR